MSGTAPQKASALLCRELNQMDEDLYQEGLMLFQQRLAQLQAAGSLQELPSIPAADLKVLQAEAANQSSSKPTGGLVGGS